MRDKDKLVMIIGGGVFQVPAVREAKALGYRTVVLDMDPAAPAFDLADFKEIISTKDIDAALECARKYEREYGLAAVFTAGTDVAYTVSVIADDLGLSGISPESAMKATNKFLMRKALKEGGVPHPKFAVARSVDDALEAAAEIGYPLVMKPVDNMGARGVKKLTCDADVREHFNASISFSGNYFDAAVVLEEYMSGPEISMDTLVDEKGDVHLLTVADRIITGEPFFIEIGHTVPSELPEAALADAFDVMQRAVRAVGITLGAAKADIKITPEGAKIGEITARLSGGFHSQCTDPLATGMNSTRAVLELALGKALDIGLITPKYKRTAVERAILPPSFGGVFRGVQDIEKAKAVSGVHDIFITKEDGTECTPLTSNLGKIGHIIAFGDNKKEAERAVKEVNNCLSVVVD